MAPELQKRGAMHLHELKSWRHYLIKYTLKSIPRQPLLFTPDDA